MPTRSKRPSQQRQTLLEQLRLKPIPRGLAWYLVIFMSLMVFVGVYNLIFNTESVGSWGVLLFAPLGLYWGIASLKAQPRS